MLKLNSGSPNARYTMQTKMGSGKIQKKINKRPNDQILNYKRDPKEIKKE